MQEINLNLLAIDYKNTRFKEPCNCAIAKAAKRHFNTNETEESLSILKVKDHIYDHPFYGPLTFITDKILIKKNKLKNDDIVRTIKLIPRNENR